MTKTFTGERTYAAHLDHGTASPTRSNDDDIFALLPVHWPSKFRPVFIGQIKMRPM